MRRVSTPTSTAAATTGPASGPRPASSTPATLISPWAKYPRSTLSPSTLLLLHAAAAPALLPVIAESLDHARHFGLIQNHGLAGRQGPPIQFRDPLDLLGRAQGL